MTEGSEDLTTKARMTPSDTPLNSGHAEDFYIIGIGASAGGLDAIRQFIAQIPADFQHTLVIIQHISPDHKSVMSEILARDTDHTVIEVKDGVTVKPRHIYLIPPGSNVVVEPNDLAEFDGSTVRLALVDPTPRPKLNLPIDLFFGSLAEAAGDRAIAVVLSGTGSDGSRGIRNIKGHDGLVLVQSPETAGFDGMPNAALATGIVDLTLSPDAMIKEITRYLEMRDGGVLNVEALFKHDESLFEKLLQIVGAYAEIDFSQYKEPTLKRRIARRVALSDCKSLKDYLVYIESHETEVSLLHREFLVGVTNFFRDRSAWEELEALIVPEIFAQVSQEPVKVWSVGCSTGEEAYTIAMLLEKWRIDNGVERDFRVIATDIKEESIRVARDGIYPESSMREIPERYCAHDFFKSFSGTIKIENKIKNKIMFNQHNIADHVPFINTDLVICRNLLIYLSPELQNKLLTTFSFSLRPEGFLFLGAAETVGRSDAGFAPVANRTRLFKNLGRERARIGFLTETGLSRGTKLPPFEKLPVRRKQPDAFSSVIRQVLERVDVSVIIVDDGGRVIETFGNYRSFLKLPDGAFTVNLLELVDERIRAAIALVMSRASGGDENAKTRVNFADDAELHQINVHCSEVAWETHGRAFAVTLQNASSIQIADVKPDSADDWSDKDPSYVLKLEAELSTAHEMLASTFEDLGATNEELQSSNEELQAANEELQANNEEVQSVNEELHTVNAENVERISQLESAYADIHNLLDDDQVGTILLDAELKIRRFTSGFTRYVDLRPHDIGRPLQNFASRLQLGDFSRLLDAVKHTSTTFEPSTHEVLTEGGAWAMAHIRPFRGSVEAVGGAVMTLVDVTNIKTLEAELRSQRDLLEGMVETESSGYWDWHIADARTILSPSFKAMLGYGADDLLDSQAGWKDVIHPEDLPRVVQAFEAHVSSKGQIPCDQEVRCLHKDGSTIWVIRRGRIVEWADDGTPLRMMGVHIDVSALRRREEDVRHKAEEVRSFAFIATHDLLQPMNTISNSVDVLRDELDQNLTDDADKVLGFLTSATKRMGVRISDVLEYARLQDEDYEPYPIDLNALWQSALEELKPSISTSGATVEVSPLPDAMGTTGLISRVMANLLGNALKYVASGTKPKITIDTIPAEPGFVAIRVSDNGIGIAPENRQKVFQMFSRLHNEKDYEGSGLGLALCQRIISQLGGQIWISESSDKGTSVVFSLLAAQPTEQ